MAKETNAITTEREVWEKNGEPWATNISSTKCCTKERAIELESKPSYLQKYDDNQLVKYSDIHDAYVYVPTYNYYFTYTFFFQDSRLCTPVSGNRISEGVAIPGSGGYIAIDSDNAARGHTRVYKYENNNSIQAITIHSKSVPSCFTFSYETMIATDLISTATIENSVFELSSIVIEYGSSHGFELNGTYLPYKDYVTYIAEHIVDYPDDFDDYTIKKLEHISYLYPNTAYRPYHIWVFENQYLANLLLGNDSYSY